VDGPDLAAAVAEHCELFNNCVRTGDWTPFLATFAVDSRLSFTGIRAGPFDGRAAIAAAYATAPPRQIMRLREVIPAGPGTVRVQYTWASGASGEMLITWREGQVTAVVITMHKGRADRDQQPGTF
jgi:steroid Delta-isomerase